jgi:PAS domain-containing protein/serine phosphatase RsbU (regulator of sigma subunit)
MLGFLGACQYSSTSSKPKASLGKLDLSQWNFAQKGAVQLNGEWEVFWMQMLDNQSFKNNPSINPTAYQTVPGNWDDLLIKEKKLPGQGFATYRLKIKLDRVYEQLALNVSTFSTAAKIILPKQKEINIGKIATTKEKYQPAYRPQVIVFDPQSADFELIIQIANFNYRKGGLWEPISLDLPESAFQKNLIRYGFDFLLAGSILFMALYHLGLYWLRPKDRAPFYFSILCFLVVLRILTVENILINQFVFLDWYWLIKLEYLSFYPSVAMLIIFFNAIFYKERLPYFSEILLGSIILYIGILLISNPLIISYLSLPVQVFTLLSGVYIIVLLIQAIRNQRQGAWVFAFGYLFLLACLVNDILYVYNIVITGHYYSLGLFVFMFSQAFLLSARFSTAFNENEKLTVELNYTTQNLEKIVEEKTQSLQKSNEDLIKKQEILKATEAKLTSSTIEILESNTALARAKIALEKISSFQKSILQSADISIITTDLDGLITSINPTTEKYVGYTAEELVGKEKIELLIGRLEEGLGKEDSTEAPILAPTLVNYQVLWEKLKLQSDQTLEWTYTRKNQTTFPINLRISEVRDENQQLIGYLGAAIDITEAKNRDFEIIRQQKLLSQMGQIAKIGAWEFDIYSGELVMSDEMYKIFDITPKFDVINNYAQLYAKPSYGDLIREKMTEVNKTNEPQGFEVQLKNGSWVSYLLVKIKDEKGHSKISGIVQDITFQKLANQEITNTYTRLKALIQNLQAGVLLEDNNRKITLVNQIFCDMFSISMPPEQILGADCQQATEQSKYLFRYSQVFADRIEAILRERKIVSNEAMELADGKFYERDFIPIWVEGVYLGHLWLYRDITQRKLQEKTLILLNADAIETNLRLQSQSQRMREQYKKIRDSISYASRIQEAILPPKEQIDRLLPKHFVFYRPRDVVSGDFYWVEKVNNKLVVAVVDCTGHGVPGAFMSMLGNSFLDNIVIQNQLLNPAQILQELNKMVAVILKQEFTNNRDGMDIAICVIDQENKTFEFAGAHSNLIFIKDDELAMVRGDRLSIGGDNLIPNEFTNHQFTWQKNINIYLSSDGYADQLGGEKSKKFMTPRFRELLFNIYKLPMNVQRRELEQALEDWQGEAEQTDDILVLGFSFGLRRD